MHAAIDVIYRRNHIHHCTRGLWLDWQAQGTRVTQNLFHDNVPPVGTRLADSLCLGEDIFVEVSHGPTLIDHNLLLSPCACRLSAQGLALVHNLIAGSFTWVGYGTDNGAGTLQSCRYTPYHVPHRTEVAGFMTILHGDARFCNNIFVQQPIREDLSAYVEQIGCTPFIPFTCGTMPYNGYPTSEEYRKQFTPDSIDHDGYKDFYYDHMPVYTGGNVFFNGAKPCDTEKNFREDREHVVTLALAEKEGAMVLDTDLYQYLPRFHTPFISTEYLGEAFEPEERFENPDGTPILFDSDYFGIHRGVDPLPGPFEEGGFVFSLYTRR